MIYIYIYIYYIIIYIIYIIVYIYIYVDSFSTDIYVFFSWFMIGILKMASLVSFYDWSCLRNVFFQCGFGVLPGMWCLCLSRSIWARVKRRYERLQLRSAITTQNMWFTVCSDRGPYVAIPLFRLCLWLKLPVGRMTFQSFDVRVRHWSSRSGLVFLGSCKMACRQVYMR